MGNPFLIVSSSSTRLNVSTSSSLKSVIFSLFFLNVYLFLRETETECEWVRGRERGRHRIWSRLPGSQLSAQSPTRGSNSRAVRSWPEPKSDAQPTEPPRRPKSVIFSTDCLLGEISDGKPSGTSVWIVWGVHWHFPLFKYIFANFWIFLPKENSQKWRSQVW